MTTTTELTRRKGGIPRGLSATGPVLFSYGFRPFFLGGALWALVTMAIWICAITGHFEVGGDYGARAWHAHEMLFGFASAIVAGFLLTAVPNWTGRLPVSGPPLMALFLLWCAGRIAITAPGIVGVYPSIFIEGAFLPVMLVVCVREIVAGRKWADLKVVAGLGALALANACFHYEVLALSGPDHSERLALGGLTMMIVIVGGRMLPSFTRNWLNKSGRTDFPVPYNRFDLVSILLALPALALWIAYPDREITGAAAVLAGLTHAVRLWRWRGWTTAREPLVLVLHLAYAFVPAGFAAVAASAFGVMDATSAMHVVSVGTVATMMIAVMTRATRGHTGRELTASAFTRASFAAILASAIIRPLTSLTPEYSTLVYSVAALMWMASFALYLIEYGPMLVARRKPSARAS